jgi:hypothetical protein
MAHSSFPVGPISGVWSCGCVVASTCVILGLDVCACGGVVD